MATRTKPAAKTADVDDAVPIADAELTERQEDKLVQLAKGLKGAGVHAKVAWVRNHVGTVSKTGQFSSSSVNYKFMQEHGLINVLRPLWRIAGLDVQVGADRADHYMVDTVPTAKGGVSQRAIVVVRISATDIEEPHGQVHAFYANEGLDAQDKAFGKAYTGAVKYALQKFFLVPTDQIDDNDAWTPERVPGTDVASEVAEAVSAKPAPGELEVLRTELRKGVEKGYFDVKWVTNTLAARYRLGSIEELDKLQFAGFSQVVANKIAGEEAIEEASG